MEERSYGIRWCILEDSVVIAGRDDDSLMERYQDGGHGIVSDDSHNELSFLGQA